MTDKTAMQSARPMSGVALVLGALALIVATGAMAVLVFESLTGLGAFGCGGENSPCALAARDAWGTLPVLGYPVSFVGFAFFLGMLIAWLMSPMGVSMALVWFARLAAVVSLAFLGRILFVSLPCMYCLVAHVANLVFWAVIEWTAARQRRLGGGTPRVAPVAALIGVAALSTLALAPIYNYQRAAVQERDANRAAADVDRILANNDDDSGSTSIEALSDPGEPVSAKGDAPAPATDTAPPTVAPPAATDGAADSAAAATTDDANGAGDAIAADSPPDAATPDDTTTDAVASAEPFTGRYRLGPDPARVRVVMFMDYQCKDCKRVEGEAMKLAEERDDVSLSVKHFPMSTDCNPNTTQNTHPNACWAARLAEAIGELYGNDAFWDAHRWLFARGGSFTAQELGAGLRELGYEGQRGARIIRLMQNPRMEELVKQDIDEGVAYGLYYTPMVFINGVEFRPGVADGAMTKAIERILASDVPARSAAEDRPPAAMAKFLSDYRGMGKRRLPEKDTNLALGPDDARVEVMVWGDFFEKGTRESAALIREALETFPDTRFVFRYYPLNIDCNPAFARMADKTRDRFEDSCTATRIVEAAGQVGGAEAYWKMHAWVCDNIEQLTLSDAKAAAAEFGIDAAPFEAAVNSPAVQAVIDADCEAAGKIGIKSIPTIFIGGRQVPRWKIEGQNALKEMVRAAHED